MLETRHRVRITLTNRYTLRHLRGRSESRQSAWQLIIREIRICFVTWKKLKLVEFEMLQPPLPLAHGGPSPTASNVRQSQDN
jgi:hypothetical protein